MEVRGQLTVLHSALGRHRVRASVERYYPVERPQREQVVFAVGYRVERMACAERSELVVLSHDLLHLLDRLWVEDVPRAVADVARPVRERRRWRKSRGRRTRAGNRAALRHRRMNS